MQVMVHMISSLIWLKDKKTRYITVWIFWTALVKKAYFCTRTNLQISLYSFSDWDTEDVVLCLETNGLHEFMQGFKGTSLMLSNPGKFSVKNQYNFFSHVDQKMDGMRLKEGLLEDDLVSWNVHTVGEKRLLQRKLSEFVGKPQN